MGSILKVKDAQGNWIDIPAITGKSAYEIAVDYGFNGSEAEWNAAVNKAANEARASAQQAQQAESVASTAAETATQAAIGASISATKCEDSEAEAVRAADAAEQCKVVAENERNSAWEASNRAVTARDEAQAAANGINAFYARIDSTVADMQEELNKTNGDVTNLNNKVEGNLLEMQQTFNEVNEASDRLGGRVTDVEEIVAALANRLSEFVLLRGFITIKGGAANWTRDEVIENRYGQVVEVDGVVITPYSKVDMQLNSEQVAIFYEKDLAFVTENDNGVVTVYCIGQIPENDYTIQVTVTEVAV